MTRLDLDRRVVVITGGANGIGFAVAAAAHRRGATVALLDVDGTAAIAHAAELGGDAVGFAADVTDLKQLESALAEVVGRLGGIDVLVANAGIGPKTTTVSAGDRAHQQRLLDVNLTGVWHTLWAGAEQVASRQGHIVIVSSIAAWVVTPAWAAYSASKAAVEQLGRSMRIELAPTGATVGVAHFGLVDTALVETFEADPITAAVETILPKPFRAKVSPADAAEALVRDIERRRPRTIYPARWYPTFLLRGVLGPVSDAVIVRHRRIRALMAQTRDRDLIAAKEATW